MNKFLLIPLMLLFITSCNSENALDGQTDTGFNEQVITKYQTARKNVRQQVGITLSVLRHLQGERVDSADFGKPTDGTELLTYLTSLPSETIDSLYTLYCTPENQVVAESVADSIFDAATKGISPQQLQQLVNFTDCYFETGGHNLTLLTTAVSGMPTNAQDYMINFAAKVDEYSLSHKSRLTPEICMQRLFRDAVFTTIEGEVTTAAIEALTVLPVPGIDLAAQLTVLGLSVESVVRLVHEYNLCMQGGIHVGP